MGASESFGRIFLALGPIIILGAGTILTLFLAASRTGKERWLALFFGPIATITSAFLATALVTKLINPSEGSGLLLGGLAMGLFLVLLLPYYPILIICLIVRFLRSRRNTTNPPPSSS